MSFLSPLFLAGALLIAGPIVFHLIRRATRNRIAFSVTEFLDESPPRLQRRSRIQNPWLLLLRCLVIGLLALAFARPYFSKDVPILPQGAAPVSVAIAIDESASMQREGIWEKVIDATLEEASKLGPADQLSIIAFSDSARTVLSYEQWSKTPFSERSVLLGKLLADHKPGWKSTSLDLGIETAMEQLDELTELHGEIGERKIILISDLVKGSRVASLTGRDWPTDTRLKFHTIDSDVQGNAGMQWLGWAKQGTAERKARIGLRSTYFIEPVKLNLQLKDALNDTRLGESIDLRLNGDETRLLLVDIPVDAEGPFKLELSGDPTEYDNTLFFTQDQPRKISTQYYGTGDEKKPDHAAFFLSRAIAGWKDPIVDFQSLSIGHEDSQEAGIEDNSFLVINRELFADELEKIKSSIEAGAYALFLLKEDAHWETLRKLADEPAWQPKPVEGSYALFGQIDFQHPLFALFADPKYSDFSKIRFWKAQSLEMPSGSEANIAARFDDDSPAVIEKAIGKGRLIVWGGDWSPEASQWVLSSKFVPWLQRLVERSVGGQTGPSIASIDDPGLTTASSAVQWKPLGEENYAEQLPQAPGLYQLKEDNRERWVALNVSSEESNTSPLEVDVWDQLGVPLENNKQAVASNIQEKNNRLKNAIELESQQKLWRWLILATVGFLVAESLVAINLGKRRESAAA